MNSAAMIIGSIWGLLLAAHSLYVYYAGKLGAAIGAEGSTLLMVVSFIVPILVLVGAGISKPQPRLGGVLMLVGAILIFYIGGINGVTTFFAIPVVVAGGLALLAKNEAQDLQTNPVTSDSTTMD